MCASLPGIPMLLVMLLLLLLRWNNVCLLLLACAPAACFEHPHKLK